MKKDRRRIKVADSSRYSEVEPRRLVVGSASPARPRQSEAYGRAQQFIYPNGTGLLC